MPFLRRSRRLGEREIADPDWAWIEEQLADGEERLAAGKGWTVGGSGDHPCAVFLTDRAIYVDVRPDASIVGRETITIAIDSVAKCQLGTSDIGSPRLVIMFDPVGAFNPSDVRGVGIDLRPHDAGRRFGQRVVVHVERFQAR